MPRATARPLPRHEPAAPASRLDRRAHRARKKILDMEAARDAGERYLDGESIARTGPSSPYRPVGAGPADRPVRPAGGLVTVSPAAGTVDDVPAFVLLVGGVGAVHSSGRIRAGRGRSFWLAGAAVGRSPVAVWRTPPS